MNLSGDQHAATASRGDPHPQYINRETASLFFNPYLGQFGIRWTGANAFYVEDASGVQTLTVDTDEQLVVLGTAVGGVILEGQVQVLNPPILFPAVNTPGLVLTIDDASGNAEFKAVQYLEPVTNGDPALLELVFDSTGDVVMALHS